MPIQRAKINKTKQITNLEAAAATAIASKIEAGAITATQLNDQAQASSNRNLIINGAMNVSQRGTSFSYAHDGTTSAFTLDRFKFIMSGTDELDGTVTQSSDVPSGKGFANSLKWTTGTAESAVAADEVMYIEHMVEAQNVVRLRYGTADAKSVTLSFWVKSSITGTFNCSIYQSDGSRVMTKTYTISSANTWEHKSLTFAGDTSGTINDDNGEGLRPYWNIFVGSNYTGTDRTSWGSYSSPTWGHGHAQNAHATTGGATFLLTGVQLEVGDKATEFEHELIGTTLAKCQRYYTRFQATSNYSYYGSGVNSATTTARIFKSFPVEMNHVPTLEQSANNTWNIYPPGQGFTADATINNASTWGSAITCTTGANLTTNSGSHCTAYNTTNAYFAFESEL